MVDVGDPAPSFVLRDQEGVWRSLEELNDRPLLLVFYPADNTPGCTAQACDIRDRWSDFVDAGVRVVGVSPDDAVTHAGFIASHALPQTLLSDPDHTMLEAYGVWGERLRRGETVIGVIRSNVLIGKDGRILRFWHNVDPRTSTEETLQECRALLA